MKDTTIFVYLVDANHFNEIDDDQIVHITDSRQQSLSITWSTVELKTTDVILALVAEVPVGSPEALETVYLKLSVLLLEHRARVSHEELLDLTVQLLNRVESTFAMYSR